MYCILRQVDNSKGDVNSAVRSWINIINTRNAVD